MKKFLKVVLVIVIILIGGFFITGIFAPGDFHVERTITINKDKSTVYNYLKNLENQQDYGYWQQIDPNAKYTLAGTDGTVGAIVSWVSDHDSVGVGEQEIIKLTEGERIDLALRFKKPDEMNSTAFFTTTGDETTTNVAWGIDFEVPYPFNTFMLMADMDGMLGPQLDYGLKHAKDILEKE